MGRASFLNLISSSKAVPPTQVGGLGLRLVKPTASAVGIRRPHCSGFSRGGNLSARAILASMDRGLGLPTWGVVLAALLVPLVIAVLFLTAMDYANPPSTGPLQPGEGQQIADANNWIMFVHALAQLAFLVFGALWLPRSTRARIAFLAITIPYCVLVFLISVVGLLAP